MPHACLRCVKIKPLILHHPEQVLARQVSQYETVPIGTVSSPSEGGRKPGGKATGHWLQRVKDIPHAALCQSQTQAVAVRGERVTTVPPSLCQILHVRYLLDLSHD